MHTMTEIELTTVNGGENVFTIWGAQAAADGLNWASKSGGNPLVMAHGTLLASVGGWVWAIGSAWEGVKIIVR